MIFLKEAMFWEKEKNLIHCTLCHRNCRIPDGNVGFCRIRKNIKGRLYALTYGKACAYYVDPIEKKPFYHFHPGENAFSIATVGCNYHCLHCINPDISQAKQGMIKEFDIPPEKAVEMAEGYGTRIIAYTYTEPTVFYEYAHDTGVLARKKNMLNTFVTNGYAQTPVIKNAAKDFLDAARIDLKGDAKHYKEICGNVNHDDVLQCIKDYYNTGMHIEIISLIIPGDNDNRDFVRSSADFLKSLGRKGKDIPWHFIQFFPTYKMTDVPRTPVKTLEKMRNWAKEEGMNYAYTGNVAGHNMESTYCPNCNKLLIERYGFSTRKINLTLKNKCPECGKKIPVVL